MADYMESVADRPIVPDVKPGELLEKLPMNAPEMYESFDVIFDDFKSLVVPSMTHWNHPGFFAYFPANASPPSILAEMLTAAMGAQCMSWNTSPAAAELEHRMMDWLRDMIGLPSGFTGVIQDTASTATFVAVVTARDRSDVPLAQHRIYTSAHAHTSVLKAAKMAGYDVSQVRLVDVDATFSMRPDALEIAMREDIEAGAVPVTVIATIGTTTTGAVDPVDRISTVAQNHNAWLHIDAAWAGAVAILPEMADHFRGIDKADSFVFNPHKWMLVNFDCSAFFVRDTSALMSSFASTASYLETGEQSGRNYRDWGPQLGRRFRALKLWFVLRSYGVDGLRALFREHLRMAVTFSDAIGEIEGLSVIAPVHFGLVCFRHDDDGQTQRLYEAINANDNVYLTSAVVDGRPMIRVSVGQYLTTDADIERLVKHVKTAMFSG